MTLILIFDYLANLFCPIFMQNYYFLFCIISKISLKNQKILK